MSVQTETLQVTGIRCERCVGRLAATLRDHPGLEQANANLMGQVTLSWDDERTSRDDLLAALARGGFRRRLARFLIPLVDSGEPVSEQRRRGFRKAGLLVALTDACAFLLGRSGPLSLALGSRAR